MLASGHLALAVLLDDFCVGNCDEITNPGCTPTPTGAVLGLLPAVNNDTVTYFLECPAGADSPFAEVCYHLQGVSRSL